MRTTLAIMAHGGAQSTVDEFLPKWEACNPTLLICSLPEGEHVDGFTLCYNAGKSAYSGYEVFRRFILTLECCLETVSDIIVISEYDTVPLKPALPKCNPGCVTSYFVLAEGPIIGRGLQLCALSPWVMDRPAAELLLAACKQAIIDDPDYPAGKGLLDRWLGHVIHTHNVPRMMGMDMLGYPWHDGAHDRIKWMGFNWIHGWKRKEEFKDLWT